MVPVRAHIALISTQHDETITNDEIVVDHVIKLVLREKTIFMVMHRPDNS